MTKTLCVASMLLSACAVDPEGDDTSTTEQPVLAGWSTATRIDVLASTYTDGHPSIRADGLELYFTSSRSGNVKIYRSVRWGMGDPWSAPVAAPELDLDTTIFYDQPEAGPELSDDGLTIWLACNLDGSNFDIFKATRATLSSSWGPPGRVSSLSSTGNDQSPYVITNQKQIYFTRGVGSQRDIYRAAWSSTTSTWGDAVAVARFNSIDHADDNLTMTGDRLEAYFDSDRDGGTTIYRSARATAGDPWSKPALVDELVFGSQPDITPDGQYIVFVKNGDLYEATR